MQFDRIFLANVDSRKYYCTALCPSILNADFVESSARSKQKSSSAQRMHKHVWSLPVFHTLKYKLCMM